MYSIPYYYTLAYVYLAGIDPPSDLKEVVLETDNNNNKNIPPGAPREAAKLLGNICAGFKTSIWWVVAIGAGTEVMYLIPS
jgi:hypothetical protein